MPSNKVQIKMTRST